MNVDLWTVHARPGASDLAVVGEAGAMAAVPPIWALWHGDWPVLGAMLAALGAAAALEPAAVGTVWLGLAALTWTEGATLRRLSLRLLGWREVAAVVAGSEAGAEEAYLTGAPEAVQTRSPVRPRDGAAGRGDTPPDVSPPGVGGPWTRTPGGRA